MNFIKRHWIVILLLMFIGGAYFFPKVPQIEQTLGGTFTPVQSQKFTLAGSGITTNTTSIIVNNMLLPDGITNITMSMFGSIGYAVISPGTSREENISFTGITVNTNDTSTMTGVSRGLAFTAPYASTPSLSYGHAGGSYIIFSNSAPFYSQFAVLSNNQTFSGIDTFSQSPIVPTPTLPTQVANKSYADSIAVAGSPNADTLTKGIVQIATQAQAVASTLLGSTGAHLAIPSSMTTDTPSASSVVMSSANGFINQAWLDFTNAWTFAGNVVFNGTATFNGNSIFNGTPTFTSFLATGTTSTSTISGNLQILNTASTTNLTISGTCSGCSKTVIVTGTSFFMSNIAGSVTTGTATCPVGYVAIGGGGNVTQNNGDNAMFGSYPSSLTVWAVSYIASSSNGGGIVTPYAVCIQI